MSRNWIAVASAEHVRRGRATGFMQVCHGKASPLRRVQPGDRVVYYSPTVKFQGKEKLRAFTALGIVKGGEPYQADMGNGFCPFRRDVQWLEASDARSRRCSLRSTSRRRSAAGGPNSAMGCSLSVTAISRSSPRRCGPGCLAPPSHHFVNPRKIQSI